MKLRYFEFTLDIKEIEERIKNMSLAYKALKSDTNIEPALVDGSKEYLGVEKMNIYLDQLDQEKEQWYYCDC